MSAVHGQAYNSAALRRGAAFSTSGHSSSQQASTLQEMKWITFVSYYVTYRKSWRKHHYSLTEDDREKLEEEEAVRKVLNFQLFSRLISRRNRNENKEEKTMIGRESLVWAKIETILQGWLIDIH